MRTRLTGPPNPYEVYFFIACVLVGAVSLLGISQPTSIEVGLSSTFRLFWAVSLLFGGAIALAGLFWRGNAITSIKVKRSGILFTATGTFIYAGIVVVLYPRTGGGVYIPNFAFTVASLVRVIQVSWLLDPSARWVRRVNVANRYLLGLPPRISGGLLARLRKMARGRGER